ncbi:hypothetical protein GQ457_07G007460 [Hibiscus cannabinus]
MSHQRSMYKNRKHEEELKRLTLVHPNNQESKVRKLLPEASKNRKSQFPETREFFVKESSFDIHLPDFIIMKCSYCKQDSNGFKHGYREEGFIIVYTMNLSETFSD